MSAVLSSTLIETDGAHSLRYVRAVGIKVAHIGKDLQFIRINGTLVGGAVGLLLFLSGLWLAP